jgi:acetolactate synthase I/II/III large subunit
MRDFGIRTSTLEAARELQRHNATVDVVVRRLLERTTGKPDGMVAALIGEMGADDFGKAAHIAIGVDPDDAGCAVASYLQAPPSEILLTGAEAIAWLISSFGIRKAFAYAGTSELAICDALARSPSVDLVNSRGDKEASFMAAGASMLDSLCAVAVLHGARGLTNAAGALGDIRRNEIPSLHLVGLPATGSARYLPPHGEPDLVSTIAAFAKGWYEFEACDGEDERDDLASIFVSSVAEAIAKACSRPCGPVLIGLPQDVSEREWIPWRVAVRPPSPSGSSLRLPSDMTAGLELLRIARKPVIMIDDYLLKYESARSVLAAFSGKLGAHVFQVRYRRGPMLFERLQPYDMAGFVGWLDPEDLAHKEILGNADLLITLEDRNMYKRVVGDFPASPKLAITSDASKVLKNEYLCEGDTLLEGDVISIMRKLHTSLEVEEKASVDGWTGSLATSKPLPDFSPNVSRVRSGIVACIATALTRTGRPILVDDSQMFGGLIAAYYDALPPGTRVFGDHGGFVGAGIATATGLALADKDLRVFCTVGDQGVMNGLQGFVSAGQEHAKVVFIVCNNGGSVSLSKQSCANGEHWLEDGREPYLENSRNVDYCALGRSLGIDTATVDFGNIEDLEIIERRLSDLSECFGRVLSLDGPALIELRLPGIGPVWNGVWITQGFEEDQKTVVEQTL